MNDRPTDVCGGSESGYLCCFGRAKIAIQLEPGKHVCNFQLGGNENCWKGGGKEKPAGSTTLTSARKARRHAKFSWPTCLRPPFIHRTCLAIFCWLHARLPRPAFLLSPAFYVALASFCFSSVFARCCMH